MSSIEVRLASERDMLVLGARLARLCCERGLVTLQGGLGAGKTTLVRGLLHAAGHVGAVKSPTFSLVEPYEINDCRIFHFDLYRLQDPEELEYIGIRDYLDESALCLVEWPEKAGSLLPVADINIMIRLLNEGRSVRLETFTDRGQALFDKLGLASLDPLQPATSSDGGEQ
jgi:tRNA threonylcarbamoyladenosine biosynthesis protein TsaE